MSEVAFGRVDQESAVAAHQLGDYYTDSYGRKFVYCKNGATALGRGKLTVASTVVANHVNLSFQTAPVAGDNKILVTLGATALTADQYKDGWLVVQDGTGQGRSYPIEGNLAADSAGTATIYLKEKIDTTGAVSEAGVDLLTGDYNGVVISAADQADTAVGVPIIAVTASYFFWNQCKGNVAVLMDEAIAVGLALTIGSSVAGAVEAKDGAGEQEIGVMGQTAGVDTEYQMVCLKM